MTQNEFLLKHLRSGKSITSLQAHKLGITSLAKRICEIESTNQNWKRKNQIKKIWKTVKTRYGKGKTRVIEYSI
jgi:hypothetical protein